MVHATDKRCEMPACQRQLYHAMVNYADAMVGNGGGPPLPPPPPPLTSSTAPQCTYFRSTPNYNVSSFDEFGQSFVAIFYAVTLEGWVDIMYQLQDSFNPSVVAVFFACLAVFGGMFSVNLVLAVLEEATNAEIEAKEEREKEKQSGDMEVNEVQVQLDKMKAETKVRHDGTRLGHRGRRTAHALSLIHI